MWNLEISGLLKSAKDASIKVIDGQEVNTSDFESIFKVVNYNQNKLWENLSSWMEAIKNKLVESIEWAAKMVVDYMYETLLDWKDIGTLFIDDVLNNWNTIWTLFNNANSLLPDDLRLSDTDAIRALNNKIALKVESELDSMDQTEFDKLDNEKLEYIAAQLDKLDYLDDDTKDNVKVLISWALFGKIAPELEQYQKNFSDEIKKAINKSDTTFNVKKWKDDFVDMVRKIEANSITRWSASEEYMADCKRKFENLFDDWLTALIKKITESVIVKNLEECETIEEIKDYTITNQTYTHIFRDWTSQFFDKDKEGEAEKFILGKIEAAKITIRSRPPRVKTYTDSVGNEYAKFKDEVVPVAHHEKKTHRWRMDPKRLPDWNVVITFKDLKSGKVIEPSMAKRLRLDYPYEMTAQEWKEVQRETKGYQKKMEEIEKLKDAIAKGKDEEKKKELVIQLKDAMQNIPHFARVQDKLSIFDESMWDYIEDKIPDFDADRIKITNSKKFLICLFNYG